MTCSFSSGRAWRWTFDGTGGSAEVAGVPLIGASPGDQLRRLAGAAGPLGRVECRVQGAPAGEAAAGGGVDGAGQLTAQHDSLPVPFHHGIGYRDRGEQRLRVWM